MQQHSSKLSSIKAIHDLARRNKIFAEYHLEKESGPAHAKLFTIRLRLGEKEYIGVDRSIKLAQRAAAQTALDDHNHLPPMDNQHQDIAQINNVPQSPTVILNTWAMQHNILIQYVLLNEEFLPSSRNYSCTIFYYRLCIGHDLYFDGHGSSHQQARINCACQALNFIDQNQISIMISTPPPPQIPPKSQISLMYERAKELGFSVQIEQNDPLTITYHIGEHYSATSTGATKHIAKQLAAEKMLEILPIPEEKIKEKSYRKRTNQHKKFIEQKGLSDYSLSQEINPITRLYQIAHARNIKIEFNDLEKLPDEKSFRFHVKFGDHDFVDGYGKSKQSAKRSAAENLLLKLNPDLSGSTVILTPLSLPPPPTKGLLKRTENASNKQQEKKHVHFVEPEKSSDHQSSITAKQQLINASEKLNINIEYQDNMITNDNNQYESIVSLSKDDRLLAQFRGNGPSVIQAQENASLAAWNNLQQLFNGSIPTPKSTINKRYRRVQTPVPI